MEVALAREHAPHVAALGARLHPRDQLTQPRLVARRHALLRAHDDELLERGPQRRQLVQLARAEVGDARAAVWPVLDESLLGEPRERLAHGDVARAELGRELPLDESRAGRVAAVANRGADLVGRMGGAGGHACGGQRHLL